MRRIGRMIVPLLLATTAACGAGARESGDMATARPFDGRVRVTADLRDAIGRVLRPLDGRTPNELQDRIRNQVLQVDGDDNGVTIADFEEADGRAAAQLRAGRLEQFFNHDLDGDGRVTRAEYGRQKPARAAAATYVPASDQSGDSFWSDFIAADVDRDQAVTLAEAHGAVPPLTRSLLIQRGRVMTMRPSTAQDRFAAIAVFDLNADRVVTRAEVDAATTAYLAEAVAAGVRLGRDRPQKPGREFLPPLRPEPVCALPPPSADARIIRVGAYEGKQISSLAIAGQDEDTQTIAVTVEPGRGSLYVVAQSHEAVIWRFSGAVDRIERVVLSSGQMDAFGRAAAAQTGVERARTTVASRHCVGGYGKGQGTAARLLGREPEDVSVYSLGGIALPSKQPFEPAVGRPRVLQRESRPDVEAQWQELLRLTPAGVWTFRDARAVFGATAEPYLVLPQEAGLTQLLVAGAIAKDGERYRVLRPIRFPAGLAGAHSVAFMLAPGVPMPTGNRAHSDAVEEGPR